MIYEITDLSHLKTSFVCDSAWMNEQPPQKNRTFNCRFLVKPPDDKEETMEEKQQRVSQYESMQICSARLPNNSDRLESGDVSSESSDNGPCVMCVARRIPPNEKPISTPIEQFTVKLDTTGKIIAVDVIWLSSPYSEYLSKVRRMPKISDTFALELFLFLLNARRYVYVILEAYEAMIL